MTNAVDDVRYQELTKGVERTNGVPQVFSRYGFKVVVIDGKQYLEAGTPEDKARAIAGHSNGRVTFEQALKDVLDPMAPYCAEANMQCYPMSGCKRCQRTYSGSYWFCQCVAD